VAETKQRRKVCFGISLSPEAARAADARVLLLRSSFAGLELTRSDYFQLLTQWDNQHKLIEKILATPTSQR